MILIMKNPFSFKGRIKRKEFLIIGSLYIIYLLFIMLRFFPNELNEYYESVNVDGRGIFPAVLKYIVFVWILIVSSIKRIHDIGYFG